jgi:hypothetical protein
MRRLISIVAGLPLALSAIVSTAAQSSLLVLLLVEAGSLLALVLVLVTVLRIQVVSLDRVERRIRHDAPLPDRPRFHLIEGGKAFSPDTHRPSIR